MSRCEKTDTPVVVKPISRHVAVWRHIQILVGQWDNSIIYITLHLALRQPEYPVKFTQNLQNNGHRIMSQSSKISLHSDPCQLYCSVDICLYRIKAFHLLLFSKVATRLWLHCTLQGSPDWESLRAWASYRNLLVIYSTTYTGFSSGKSTCSRVFLLSPRTAALHAMCSMRENQYRCMHSRTQSMSMDARLLSGYLASSSSWWVLTRSLIIWDSARKSESWNEHSYSCGLEIRIGNRSRKRNRQRHRRRDREITHSRGLWGKPSHQYSMLNAQDLSCRAVAPSHSRPRYAVACKIRTFPYQHVKKNKLFYEVFRIFWVTDTGVYIYSIHLFWASKIRWIGALKWFKWLLDYW